MPAAVLVVHDDRDVRDLVVVALRAAFIEAVGFEDPMAALDAIEKAGSRVRVLVTRVAFKPGKPNGIALARMVRLKRPGTKVVFVAREEYAPQAEGLGVFLPRPLHPDIWSRRSAACWRRGTRRRPPPTNERRLPRPAGDDTDGALPGA